MTRWRHMDSAPIEGPFIVTDGRRMMMADGHMYSLSVLPGVPSHLSGHHWIAWTPAPELPGPRWAKRIRYLATRAARKGQRGHDPTFEKAVRLSTPTE